MEPARPPTRRLALLLTYSPARLHNSFAMLARLHNSFAMLARLSARLRNGFATASQRLRNGFAMLARLSARLRNGFATASPCFRFEL